MKPIRHFPSVRNQLPYEANREFEEIPTRHDSISLRHFCRSKIRVLGICTKVCDGIKSLSKRRNTIRTRVETSYPSADYFAHPTGVIDNMREGDAYEGLIAECRDMEMENRGCG